MELATLEEAAEIMGQARLKRKPLAAIPTPVRPADETGGYQLQEAVHRYLSGHGHGAVVGHKIGCTTIVMQDYLKIHNPCGGGVFEPTVRVGSGSFDLADFVRPGVECEIAVRLGTDLPQTDVPYSRADVVGAVAACMAAIEVVDDRYVDFTTLGAPTLIADDFFGAGCVLGNEVEGFDPNELVNVSAHMDINGQNVGEGRGSDVLGDPLDALAWLANTMSGVGSGLRTGQFILLGSVVKTVWLDSASDVVAINSPLGRVSATFS